MTWWLRRRPARFAVPAVLAQAAFSCCIWHCAQTGLCSQSLPATQNLTSFSGSGVYQASSSVSAGTGYTIPNGANVTFQSGGTIVLQPGFHAAAGSNFQAIISPLENESFVANPASRGLTIDGIGCPSPCTTTWFAGTSHTVAAASRPGGTGTWYLFGNWSDGGAQTHTITPPPSTVYQANFTTQYYLTTGTSPPTGGAVTPVSGWYNSGTAVPVAAAPNTGYEFAGFTGVLSAKTTPQYITMNSPVSVTASFLDPAAPTPIGVTPSSGNGSSQTFNVTYSDVSGASDINQAFLLIQVPNTPNGANQCIVRYDPGTNDLYLLVDAAGSYLGPIAAGGSGSLSNSQCTLSGSSTGQLSGNTLTVRFAVTFAPAFAGTKDLFLFASSNEGLGSTFTSWGTWTVPATTPTPVSILSVSPSSGTGFQQTFTAIYSDTSGGYDISQSFLLIQIPNTPNGANQCIVRYDPGSDSLYLLVDQAGSYLGPIAANSTDELSNSQCTLSGGSSGQVSGNMLTVQFSVIFAASFAGTKQLFLFASNNEGQGSSFGSFGSWTVVGPFRAHPARAHRRPEERHRG